MEVSRFTASLFNVPFQLEVVNQCLKGRGFSNLCRMRRWVKLDAMPQLGSGKVDYVSLKKLLKEGALLSN